MGDRNTLHELTNYVMGVAPGGLVLAADGSLDIGRSFARVDYVALLNGVKVRNNVQTGVGPAPVDFTVVSVPCGSVAGVDDARGAESCIWLSSSPDAQALVLARRDPDRRLMLRYVPVSRLTAGEDGVISVTAVDWRPGLPLKLLEDEGVDLPAGDARRAWLESWHTEAEWLRATHRGLYSHAVVAIHEQFSSHEPAPPVASGGEALSDEQLIRRLRLRQRRVVEPDLNVLAGNHWNFDVRGFNPGGNHGSFFRVSAHATLMFAGGDRTGIPRGLNVEDPYDTLSFIPTVMALTGQGDREGRPSQTLRERGFSSFPGRVITEVLAPSGGEGAAVRRAP
jgi:hypothetical protein